MVNFENSVNYTWNDHSNISTTTIAATTTTTVFLPSITVTFLPEQIVDNITSTENIGNSTSISTPYGPVASVIIALVLLCVIVGTIIGNILVCIAVCLVRKLRRPCNYLLVSLAVSDLCVAILVMPVALLFEVSGQWSFGPVICDLWVSFDVLSCTASILNLCMISVDRYYAITKPLEYGVKRTPKRMIICVSLVWLGAACISLPPLLILGNEHGEDGTACSVCGYFGYQIYATLGSFYIPLTVMIVVYHKIFQAARKIVSEERRAQSHLKLTCSNATTIENRPLRQQQSAPLLADKIVVVTEVSKNGSPNPETRLVTPEGGDWPNRTEERNSTASTATVGSTAHTNPLTRCFGGTRKKHSKDPLHPLDLPPSSPKSRHQRDSLPFTNDRRKTMSPHHHTISKSRLRFTLAKERKASTTLGIIMSAFTVCWLPFFVLALVRPFLSDKDGIPQSLSSLFLWLGYANSLLNPIIYATLNKDFRKPFQQILYFRCSSLNLMMREEFYHSQYGDPNLTIAVGTTTRHRGGAQFDPHEPREEEELQQFPSLPPVVPTAVPPSEVLMVTTTTSVPQEDKMIQQQQRDVTAGVVPNDTSEHDESFL